MKKNKGITLIELMIVVVIIGILGFCLFLPHYEAKTFNKYKSDNTPEATYWDALVSELRVEAK